jgi:hypothetical protein
MERERLFSPCTRLHDLLRENQDYLDLNIRHHIENIKEFNLDVSTEELLSAESAFTYVDLYAMLGNGETTAWLTPDAAIARRDGPVDKCWMQLREPYRFLFDINDEQNMVAFSSSPEHLLEICDVVLRLLAASDVHSVILRCYNGVLISAPPLAYLMEKCESLKLLSFYEIEMDETHCRALGTCSRPDLEIVLKHCNLTNAGTSALVEALGRNQGPTELAYCRTDYSVLADGLRGNSRLKSFRPPDFNSEVSNRKVLAIADALRENRGLADLDLSAHLFKENNETWSVICDALKTHPTLEVLNLSSAFIFAMITPEVIRSRIQALLDMMKVNLSIDTIQLPAPYIHHELFRGSVIPYLETNRLRPRLLAIQKTRPIAYRAKVLGRALLSARTDANSFWMLLSGNAEIAFPSKAATATPAVNQPASATAAATASASATATLSPTTGAASTVSASAIGGDATANVGEKRKARPYSHQGLVD